MADLRIPVSPIHGMVNTTGDATHAPYIQLDNPAGSGKNVQIYELYLGQEAGASPTRFKLRRIATTGIGLGGTITTALLARRNENDAAAIVATLKGCTAHTGTIFTEADSFWYDFIAASSGAGYVPVPIIRPGSYPLIVKPGSTLEFAYGAVSSGVNIRLFAAWDEITTV